MDNELLRENAINYINNRKFSELQNYSIDTLTIGCMLGLPPEECKNVDSGDLNPDYYDLYYSIIEPIVRQKLYC